MEHPPCQLLVFVSIEWKEAWKIPQRPLVECQVSKEHSST